MASSHSHSDDTVDLPKIESDSDSAGKVCCSCGKSVEGHRRFKDSVGYWCKDCHRVDKKRSAIPEGRCPDCGRMRPLDKLKTADDGAAICSACMAERVKKAQRFAVKAMNAEAEQSHERTKLYIGLGVLVLVGVIVLLQAILRGKGH